MQYIKKIETEENLKLQEQYHKLQYYEDQLETILDIRCSPFKSRNKREALQELTVSSLSDSKHATVGDTVKYKHLKDIYDYDHRYCGNTKEENGKLRHIYIQQWKLELELQNSRNILKRICKWLN